MTKPTFSVWAASPDGWTETRRYVVEEDAWASVKLDREPFTVVLPSNETPDPADLPASLRFIPAPPPGEAPVTDQTVVDCIATMLGTNPLWSGADDLEAIANLIGKVRPHPGGGRPADYRTKFHAATGRPVNVAWDMATDDEGEG